MTIAAIRQALADAVDGVDGIRAVALVPDQANVPQAVVWRRDLTYRVVQETYDANYDFAVTVYAPRTAERASQLLLDELCEPSGATSLRAALEAPAVATAAGAFFVEVTMAHQVTVVTIGGVEYLSTTWDVTVAV